MAASCCPRPDCGSMVFEFKEIEPQNTRFKFFALQCRMCGAVVGVVDYMNIGHEVGELQKAVKEVDRRARDAVSRLDDILRLLRSRVP